MGVGREDALDPGAGGGTRAVDAVLVRNTGRLEPGLRIPDVQHLRERQVQRGRRVRHPAPEHGPQTALHQPPAGVAQEGQHTRQQVVDHVRAAVRLRRAARQQALGPAQGAAQEVQTQPRRVEVRQRRQIRNQSQYCVRITVKGRRPGLSVEERNQRIHGRARSSVRIGTIRTSDRARLVQRPHDCHGRRQFRTLHLQTPVRRVQPRDQRQSH